MATFFVPAASSPDEAEKVRDSIVQFLGQQGFNVTDRRIQKLSYLHNGRHYDAEVGKPEASRGSTGGLKRLGAPVILIFEMGDRSLYLVCTPNRGVVRGPPIMVGAHDVISISDFD